MTRFRVDRQNGIIAVLLIVLLTIVTSAVFAVISQVVTSTDTATQARQDAAAAKSLAISTKIYLNERIKLRKTKDEITEAAFERICETQNKKFAKLIPIEKQARAQVVASPLYIDHEEERYKTLTLIDSAIRELQPDNCKVHLTTPGSPNQ